MTISGFNPPIMCMAKGCDQGATLALEKQNLQTGAVTRDLYVCEAHGERMGRPGGSLTTGE